MHFSPAWNQEFEQTKSMILWATEGWIKEVCHIGGTAIADGVASPTIDVVAGLSNLSGLNEAASLLSGLQYQRHPAPDWCDRELVAWLIRSRGDDPTHTVLLVKHQGEIWKRCIAIKDKLSLDYMLREQLDQLKKDHFTSESPRPVYEQAKADFFQILMSD
jgi:GrpB-like predicted nucleotidyltransferase (UPF0157 family)